MALRGDLASVDLAQVFQMLALNKKVGLLSIHSAKQWKVLYFDQRGVTVHHNVHRLLDKVVAASVRSGRLLEESVDEVRDHAVRMGQSLADSLLAGGYLEPDELDYQYRLELEEEIYDLFFCRDAKFEFHENATQLDGRDGSIDERFFFNCDSIIMEAARRIDEWAYITERIPSTAEILVATADYLEGDEYGADGPAIFELLDGRRNVARVCELTGLTNFLVCKTLSQFLDAGLVAPIAEEDLVALGDECMNEGRLQDAIALYERAIEVGVELPDSHALAARAYQAAEQYELAVYHLESEAEHRIGEEDFDGAARCLAEVRQLIPTNLAARERLVELCVGPEGVRLDGFDALAEGKELVELLTEFGDIQRVRTLLERLLLVEPNDPDLKKALVNVHVRAGDQKRVVQLYESIADDLVRRHKPLEAVSYLQKILLLDRSRTDISERVRRLYEFDERSRKRSRALSVLAVLFCLLLVVGSGYWFYNERAEEDFATIDVTELVATEDFAGAKTRYAEFIAQHPLTTAISKAEAEMQKITSAQEMFEARLASEKAERDAHLNGLRRKYKAAWSRHREQFLSGSPEQALASIEEVRALVKEAGAAADVEWAHEQKLQLTWKNLSDFLSQAKQLGSSYDAAVASGDFPRARELALQLQTDFERTAEGRRVRVPVTVTTRPPGAQLMHDGKPLMRVVDGRKEPVLTPGLVLCQADQPVRLSAQLDGFETQEIVVNGRESAEVVVVMAVVPEHIVAFESPAQTGVGVGDGWVALGLRGGRLGYARTDGTNKQVRELGGLKAVDATPVVANGRIFFLSNEGTVECVPVESSVRTGNWPVKLAADAQTSLVLGDGRMALVDTGNVLNCWEQSSGRRLWGVSLEDAPSGPPTLVRRKAYVGTLDGRVMVFDVSDGKSLGVLRSPAGITTRIHVDGSLIVFGCADGAVRVVDFDAGKVLWTQSVGRTPKDRDLAITKDRVLIVAEDRIVVFDRATGSKIGEVETEDTVLGLTTQGDRAFARVRRPRSPQKPAHEALVAIDAVSATVLWAYALSENGPGSLGVDGMSVALPTPEGQVVLFR